jgi:gliding motility-associated-like protein
MTNQQESSGGWLSSLANLFAVILSWVFFLLLPFYAQSQCKSSFDYSKNQCFGDSITFSFTGTAQSVQWNFGDPFSGIDNTDTNRIIKHQFSDSGTYTVTCIAKFSTCTDTIRKQLIIVAPISAAFSVNDGCLNLKSLFLDKSSFDPKDSITDYSWELDSGVNSALKNPQHTYKSDGLKTIILSIVSRFGCRDTLRETFRIKNAISYQTDNDTVCQKSKITFSSNYGTDIPTGWEWDFGDGTKSKEKSPNHSYESNGLKSYKVTLTYSDGSSCVLDYDTVFIRKLPTAEFTILTDSLQCFKGNQTCLKFKSNANPLDYRNVIWDDGAKTKIPLSDSVYCYSYSYSNGGNFKIAHEVRDTFGCASRVKRNVPVTILKELKAKFETTIKGGCFKTEIIALNKSNFSPPHISKYIWDFGNGSYDSTNWFSATHTYTSGGVFTLSLYLLDSFGCTDTFTNANPIENITYTVDARLDSVLAHCHNYNSFKYVQTPIKGGSIVWNFGDSTIATGFTSYHQYPGLGIYRPKVTLSKGGCTKIVYLDSAVVYGPKAAMTVTNQYQCQISDTVYFQNASVMFQNKGVETLWQVNDIVGSTCTIDTKNGINKDSNCNFSVDSLSFQHWFTPGKEQCYFGRLILRDTIVGCSDSILEYLPLMPPDADSNLIFSYTGNKACLGPEISKLVTVDLQATKPGCAQEQYYLMWDSLCAEQSGNFDSFWLPNNNIHNYEYANRPCDSNGFVSVGLIIENGRDTLGQPCRDTAFYHHILQFGYLNPAFISTYHKDTVYCRNSSFDFHFSDSFQDSMTYVVWNFGDGTIDTTNHFKKVSHTYSKAGLYQVSTHLLHVNGCTGSDILEIAIGINKSYLLTKNEVCLGDSLPISNNSWYWNGQSFGSSNGKGVSRWDIGDGKGYSTMGDRIYLNYDKIGNFDLTLELSDSAGCKDTLNIPRKVRVFDVISQYQDLPDTLICPQLINLISASTVYDSLNNFGHKDDFIISHTWTFSGNSGISTLTNPYKFFDDGLTTLQLVVENTKGCRDTLKDTLVISSPLAHYSILNDSIGCQPHLVAFKSGGAHANDYVWYFKDNGNNTINTTSPDNVVFTYKGFGTFYPELVAKYSFTNNGIPITCSDTFPSPRNPNSKKKVIVLEKPNVKFKHITDCSTYRTQFSNLTKLKTDTIKTLLWTFGDGDSSKLINPNHQFADTGTYRVVLRIFAGNGCTDSIVKNIVISPKPIAEFVFTEVCQGALSAFTDLTQAFNDRIYLWKWDFGDNTSSTGINPTHLYAKDSAYEVELVVTNVAGCTDTISHIVRVFSNPVADFSTDNVCDKQKVIFNNLSFSKVDTIYNTWDFGDGLTSNSLNPYHTYKDTGDYTVDLSIRTNRGCINSITKRIRIYPNPSSLIDVQPTEQCIDGNIFTFSAKSTDVFDTKLDHRWYLGNGDSSLLSNFNYSYTTADTFDVSLIAFNDQNCKDTTTQRIIVHPMPISKFDIDTPGMCINTNRFTFENQSLIKGTSLNNKWYFGDGDSSSVKDPSHRYSVHSSKVITLITTSLFGCKDTSQNSVEVHPMPTAVPFVNDTAQCLNNQNVLFIDSSYIDYGSLERIWLWYNGKSDTSRQSSLTFTNDSLYTHRLISISKQGCADTLSFSNRILPLPNPKFEINDSNQCVNAQLFKFNNLSKQKNKIASYNWDFGDLNTDTLISPEHKYLLPGKYTVRLTVTSDRLCLDTSSIQVEVYHQPNAQLLVNDSQQCFNQQIFKFTGKSTIQQGMLRDYLWKIENNQFDGTKDTVWKFTNSGVHQIAYIPVSDQGCFDTTLLNITVNPNPISSFIVDDTIQCANDNLFDIKATSTIDSGTLTHLWYHDGIYNDTGISHQKTFSGTDTLLIMLLDSSIWGCQDSAFQYIYLQPTPDAKFVLNDRGQCLDSNSFITHNHSKIIKGSMNYQWSFGDGSKATDKNPIHEYKDHGDFVIQLIATSGWQCKDTLNQNILVHPEPTAAFTVNDQSQCLHSNLFISSNKSTIDSTSLSYRWFWGDGDSSNLDSPSHFYAAFGSYPVKLISTSVYGCIDSTDKTVYVNPMPKAHFTVNDSDQCINAQNFIFTDGSSIIKGSIESYTWEIGNQKYSSQGPLSHTFIQSGLESVSLHVASDSACMDTISKSVRIYPKPEALIEVNDSVQCLFGNYVRYSAESTDSFGITGQQWIMNNALVGTDDTFGISYNTPGNKLIQIISTSVNACIDSAQMWVRIKPMPDPNFETLKLHYCEDEGPFNLLPNLVGGSFSGKNIVNQQYVPRILWKDTITYIVSLEGCVDSSKQFTNVYPLPHVNLGNDTSICKHESLLLDASDWRSTYLWQNLSTDSTLLVVKDGKYYVKVSNICGVGFDTITIGIRDSDCRIFIPTAFTPGGDGLNDFYKPIIYDVDQLDYQIFNRWGEIVFKGDLEGKGWDGTYLGEKSESDWYMIRVKYSYPNNSRRLIKELNTVFYLLR